MELYKIFGESTVDFLNTNTLKIEKRDDFDIVHSGATLHYENNMPFIELKEPTKNIINDLINKLTDESHDLNKPVLFVLNLATEIPVDGENIDKAEVFRMLCNIFSNQFTLTLIRYDEKVAVEREHRLEVPTALQKGINTSWSNIKSLINYKTILPIFNFRIIFDDLIYCFVKEVEENHG